MSEKIPPLMSPEKYTLISLEKEECWVFHGSPIRISTLEPKQAYNYPNTNSSDKIPDGEPAVFASPKSDIAIFMAILNGKNAPKGLRTGYGKRDDTIEYRATSETIEQIHDAIGYIYVFPKERFQQKSELEYCCFEEIEPTQIIEVTEKDLPEIIIKDF